MKKDHFEKELQIESTQKINGENSRKEVRKIQSWLNLYESHNSGVGTATQIDGIFGRATEKAVILFQEAHGLTPTGIVDQELFELMSGSMRTAFTTPSGEEELRNKIAAIAINHAQQKPEELKIKGEPNSGPWVRAYMDGNDGREWLWCMGFVQAIIDQALSETELNFTDHMPLTYSCDSVGYHGLSLSTLVRNKQWRQDPSLIQKGDIFLSRKSDLDWTHTGIIISTNDEIIETVEGNTNPGGSRNGYGVFRRIRNFHKSTLDVFSLGEMEANIT